MAKKTVEVSPASAVQAAPQQQARSYFGQSILDHDLFKLAAAPMVRNTSYEGQVPKLIDIEHCHIYHTIDSSGRKMDTCSAVGGHFHMMKVNQTEGGVPQVTCSPAMRYVLQKINGRLQRVMTTVPGDDHTHEVVYLGSQKIQPRQLNAEGARTIAALEAPYKASVTDIERDFGRAKE